MASLRLLFIVFVVGLCEAGFRERTLLNRLLTDYDPESRPWPEDADSGPTRVNFGLTLQQAGIDEANSRLWALVWFHLEWTDHDLKWNISEFQSLVRDVRISADRIWTPRVLLENFVVSSNRVPYNGTNVVVTSRGDCTYIPPLKLLASCPLDLTFFPNDEQICFLNFTSPGFSVSDVRFDFGYSYEAATDTYVINNEWALMSTYGNIITNDQNRQIISYQIKFRRRAFIWIRNLLIPIAVTSKFLISN